MKTVVIYHRADFDGIFCREIARKFLGETAEYIGWDYNDPVPVIPAGVETIYMLDISIEALMDHPDLVWIDHHKSAMEKYEAPPKSEVGDKWIPKTGYRIDGVAACRLAWQYFQYQETGAGPLPEKQAFVDRTVSEPLAVRLAGEYDIWDKRDPDAELFQHGLRSCDLADLWAELLDPEDTGTAVRILLGKGAALQYASTQQNASIIKAYGFTVKFEGLTFLACNHARFNSHLFTAGIRPEHDALLGFNYDGSNDTWRVSLYHAPGKEEHDLSLIAVKFGGGGHRGACGFRSKHIIIPFGTDNILNKPSL